MTVLPAVPGIEVTIQSFEEDLPEYEDESWTHEKWASIAEWNRKSTYVECQSGAEFRVKIVVQNPFVIDSENLSFKASVDGHSICQIYCPADRYNQQYGYYVAHLDAKVERVTPTSVSRRPLKFASITKVDDPDSTRVKNDAKAIAGLGEIVITAFRTRIVPLPLPFVTRGCEPERVLGAPTEVAEKALKGKAISNGVAYGEASTKYQISKELIDIDGPRNPLAVFVFKYRSRQDLQAEMIIPRSPSPVQNPVEVPVDKRARLANLKREIKEIKAEEGVPGPSKKRSRVILDDDDDDIQIISSRAYKISRRPGGALVIDLTDDD